jgi:hypothetical protein
MISKCRMRYIPSRKMHPYALPKDVYFTYIVTPLDFEHWESRVNFSNPKFPFGIIETSRVLTDDELVKYDFQLVSPADCGLW